MCLKDKIDAIIKLKNLKEETEVNKLKHLSPVILYFNEKVREIKASN